MKKVFDELAIQKALFEQLPLMRRFETTSATNESLSVAAASITFLGHGLSFALVLMTSSAEC